MLVNSTDTNTLDIFERVQTIKQKVTEKSNLKNIKKSLFEHIRQQITQPLRNFVLKGHKSSATSLAISSCNTLVVSGSLDSTVRVWNILTRELETTLIGHLSWIICVALSSDDQYIASGSSD